MRNVSPAVAEVAFVCLTSCLGFFARLQGKSSKNVPVLLFL